MCDFSRTDIKAQFEVKTVHYRQLNTPSKATISNCPSEREFSSHPKSRRKGREDICNMDLRCSTTYGVAYVII
jgi:hypothetical protein